MVIAGSRALPAFFIDYQPFKYYQYGKVQSNKV